MKSGCLTPKGLHFLCLSSGDPILLCSAETVDARPTYIWLKDTTIGCSIAVEISDLNSQDCGNAASNQPCQLFRPLFSRDCHVM